MSRISRFSLIRVLTSAYVFLLGSCDSGSSDEPKTPKLTKGASKRVWRDEAL